MRGRDKGRWCECDSHVMGVLPAAKSMQGARWGVRCSWDPDKRKDTTGVDGARRKLSKSGYDETKIGAAEGQQQT